MVISRVIPGLRKMPARGERAYAYAKACGIIGKSFIGKRINVLEKVLKLSELDRIIFPSSHGNLPEKELLLDLEDRIVGRAVDSIISILGCFSKPPEFLVCLIRGYEYLDLMNALSAFMAKETAAPAYTALGRFQTVRFNLWPDIKAMIEGTAFDFLLDSNGALKIGQGKEAEEKFSLQSLLDRHYYNGLWDALLKIPASARQAALHILSDEISLKNCSCALRLRSYYHMPPEKIKTFLIEIPVRGKNKRSKNLAEDAGKCLDLPLDDYSAWSSWRWKEFLNPPLSSPSLTSFKEKLWHPDPKHFQNAAGRYLFNLARHNFRLHPFSLDIIFCFIKLKQFEEDLLTSGAEALSMGMSVKDLIAILGVQS